MKKIVITKSDVRYRSHAPLPVGLIGYLTKETEAETAEFAATNDGEKVTRVRFAASKLGYVSRDPIYLWVPDTNFKKI